ncbi:MAG: hypothetical protein KA105_02525 [Caulobacter sp.]|nr:hypothetical protein [Caulobacter sp.]
MALLGTTLIILAAAFAWLTTNMKWGRSEAAIISGLLVIGGLLIFADLIKPQGA